MIPSDPFLCIPWDSSSQPHYQDWSNALCCLKQQNIQDKLLLRWSGLQTLLRNSWITKDKPCLLRTSLPQDIQPLGWDWSPVNASKPEASLFGALTPLSFKNQILYITCTTISMAKSTKLRNRAPHPSLPRVSSAWIASYSGNPKSLLLVMIYEAGKPELYFQSTASAHNAGYYKTDRFWCSLQSNTRWPGKISDEK